MPRPQATARPLPQPAAAVLTKAALRAAARLQVPQSALSRIIGVSEATVSRMRAGTHVLTPGDKPFELAVLFVRLFRALGDVPLTLIQSVAGLVHVVAFLDAERARV